MRRALNVIAMYYKLYREKKDKAALDRTMHALASRHRGSISAPPTAPPLVHIDGDKLQPSEVLKQCAFRPRSNRRVSPLPTRCPTIDCLIFECLI